jgi:hypothetical protein
MVDGCLGEFNRIILQLNMRVAIITWGSTNYEFQTCCRRKVANKVHSLNNKW